MREYWNHGRESKWCKAAGIGVCILVLIFCAVGWKRNHQRISTTTLKDVYREARTDASLQAKNKRFNISFQGEEKIDCQGRYQAAELTDKQFARLEPLHWKEQNAEVDEYQVNNYESFSGGICGNALYETQVLPNAHVYQMRDGSRYYLLIEDREEGKEYVARFDECLSTYEGECSIGGILQDFVNIRGEGDVSKVTLEDTKEIEEGQSNILAVYTKKAEKKMLYENLCSIPLEATELEDELLYDVYGEELSDEELEKKKQERYFIGVENKQGETYVFQYQKCEKVDYLIIGNSSSLLTYCFKVPEEQKTFWRDVFNKNARAEEECEEEEQFNSEFLSAKPMIYLYPEKAKDIHVEVQNVDFTTVYPAYGNGWNVRAKKDGMLHMYEKGKLNKEREYYGLYYEGKVSLKPDWRTGFTVKRKDYQKFLEEKLRILGLSDREAEEFIVYWLPRMEQYESVDIHFAEQSLLDREVPLQILPKPDTLIRVFMQWRENENGEKLPEKQRLSSVVRKGDTVVEWGGSEVIQGRRICAE